MFAASDGQQKFPKPTMNKFEAFGNFVASSLADLPEINALELIEKFTGELVTSLINSKSDQTANEVDA